MRWFVRFALVVLCLMAGIALFLLSPKTYLQGAVLQYTGQARRSGLRGDRHFNFRVKPGRPDYEITLVKAVDDRGQEAELESSFHSQSERAFALRVSTNATSLDFTLALHRTRYFEFLARPEVISTNRTQRTSN
jgi:hypothetical protein